MSFYIFATGIYIFQIQIVQMLFKKGIIYCIILFSLFLLVSNMAYAQKNIEASGDEKIAKQFFLFGDYATALKEYQFLYSRDSTNPDYIYPLGICYLNTNIDKLKSIFFLEEVTRLKDYDPEAMYQLGVAYMVAYRFDEAIECFQKFKKLIGNEKDLNYIPLERQIEMCDNAMELVKNPINVTFENVGSRINSPYPDYNPFVNKKETVMYFSSKRLGNIGNLLDYDGYYTADIFISENKYGVWEKSKRMVTSINTPLVEETCGLSADGSYLFAFMDNLETKMQACQAVKEGRSFQRFSNLGININTAKSSATSVTISSDKKIIFFASAKEEGQGGSDIYMAKLLPTGQWGTAVNIGNEVNTQYDEDYPYLAPDGKTLYFASIGHNSMGGYDIFKTIWNKTDNTFTEPVNIGYPINTPEDNTTISFTGSGRYAYVSALRKDTYGNLDIYRVIFNDVKPGNTTLIGNLTELDSVDVFQTFRETAKATIDSMKTLTDSSYIIQNNIPDSLAKAYKTALITAQKNFENGPEVSVKVSNNATNTLTGTYRPNRSTGKLVIILPPGEFAVNINCEGYQELTETIKIDDREIPAAQITKTFRLTKK